MAYFPFFIDIKNKLCLVVGSGKIAKSKIHTLMDFEADVTCISKEFVQIEGCTCIQKEVELKDIDNFDIVIAATDNKTLNHKIASYCKDKNILVNAVDQKEDCMFIFPSLIHQKNVVAAFSSSGKNPLICQYLRKQNENIVTEQLGDINEKMEVIRNQLKDIDIESRKKILKEFLLDALEK